MPRAIGSSDEMRGEMDAQTVALRLMAGLLVIGAAWWLSSLLVPTALAMVLAIALSPVADWLQRAGLPRALASLACVLGITLILVLTASLILYQAGIILRDSERYLRRFSEMLAAGARLSGSERALTSLGLLRSDEVVERPRSDRSPAASAPARDHEGRAEDEARNSVRSWESFLRRNLSTVAGWLTRGIGGLFGFLGGLVVFLALLFYMLQTRHEWVDRAMDTLRRLGLRPNAGHLEKVRGEIVTYIGCLSLVATGYATLVSLILWLVGVPQPLLWGVLAGLLEFVPYFGPLIASILPTIVALSLGTWWQPAAVVAQYIGLHVIEGYVVTPLLYGRAVQFNPVTILLGALFFGWLWGPLGLALAMPMMILLRGLLDISPGTPALHALAGTPEEAAAR
ncbi:MAG: AI-2E family transporter [Isosphaeraceae bacterium]|nr:AI-2E family transporter [Isosphaeraceae bacterium]